MSIVVSIVVGFMGLGEVQSQGGREQAAPPATRVVEGRVTDTNGNPVREGKVMFAPQNPPWPFQKSGMAAIDAQGHYRIELATFSLGTVTMPATGALRYQVLVPGFRGGDGRVAATTGPAKVDVQLTPEEWRTTEILLVDRDGKPVADGVVSLELGGTAVWSRQASDARGRCLVKSAPNVAFRITVEKEGYLPTQFATRATPADPTSFTIPLYATIDGRVVDPDGKPLPGIQIGMMLAEGIVGNTGSGLKLYPLRGLKDLITTDAQGRFKLAPLVIVDGKDLGHKPDLTIWHPRICFADKDLRRVLFGRLDVQGAARPYEITLRPARALRIPIEHSVAVPNGAFVSGYNLYDLADTAKPEVVVVSGISRHGPSLGENASAEWIELSLPEGKYRLQVDAVTAAAMQHVESTASEVVVPAGEGPLTLPPIRMTVAPFRALVGKPAPEIDAKDAQTSAPVKLADYRGKVVVLDFWGQWCGPCLSAMAHLIEAHDRYRGKPVVMIALHDQSVQSYDELKTRLSGVKRQLWNNRDIPFTVVFDRPDPALGAGDSAIGRGMTIARYKVHGFPTTLVIDQDGKVVGRVEARDDDALNAMIEQALKNATR